MFSTIHGTTGAIAAKLSGNIFVGFFLAILLHFIFDAIPHGDENLVNDPKNPTKKEMRFFAFIAVLDFIIMSAIICLLWYYQIIDASATIALGIFGGLLPDLINGVYIIFKIKILKPFMDFHEKVHDLIPIKLSLKQGLIFQAIFTIILLTAFILI